MTTQNNLVCMVVDDEPHAIELLEMYIDKTPFLELRYKETNPWEAIKIINQEPIDLLFLDIQMESLSGLQVLDVLEKYPPVVLTTAYEEYALKAYEYKVLDYLLKPYSYDRFLKSATSAMELKKGLGVQIPKRNSLVGPESDQVDHIFLKGDAKNKFHRLAFDEILFIEGLKNYVSFHCLENKITTLYKLSDLENELPSNKFVRIHKSHIINLDQVKLIDGNLVKIADKSLPIGASYKADFLARIKK